MSAASFSNDKTQVSANFRGAFRTAFSNQSAGSKERWDDRLSVLSLDLSLEVEHGVGGLTHGFSVVSRTIALLVLRELQEHDAFSVVASLMRSLEKTYEGMGVQLASFMDALLTKILDDRLSLINGDPSINIFSLPILEIVEVVKAARSSFFSEKYVSRDLMSQFESATKLLAHIEAQIRSGKKKIKKKK